MRVQKAAPDGYTIGLGHMGTHAAAVGLYPNLSYDPAGDFKPIGLTAGTPVLIIARKDLPPANLKEFMAYVTANASKINQAHGGVGSISHMACLLLNSILRVDPVKIPFSGSGPALNAIIGGQVDYLCSASGVSQVASGIVKAYAITTPERNPALPDVPTTREAGLPESRSPRGMACLPRTALRTPWSELSPMRSTERLMTLASASAFSIWLATSPAKIGAVLNS